MNSVILIRKIRRAFHTELRNAKKTTILGFRVCFCSCSGRKLWTNSWEMPKMRRFLPTCNRRERAGLISRVFEKWKWGGKGVRIWKSQNPCNSGERRDGISAPVLHPGSLASAEAGGAVFFRQLDPWTLRHPAPRHRLWLCDTTSPGTA